MSKSETENKADKPASTEVMVPSIGGPGAMILGGKSFRTAKWVTRTVLQQEMNRPFYVRFEGAIGLSTMDPENSKFKDAKGDGAVPEIANVINLETGEYQVLIINTVLGSELRRAYPDNAYVGKMFGVMQSKSDIDKRYKSYKIIELELDEKAPGGADPVREIDGTTPEAIERAKSHRNKVA